MYGELTLITTFEIMENHTVWLYTGLPLVYRLKYVIYAGFFITNDNKKSSR